MSTKCWICGAQADSKEHRIKARDIRRAFGKGPYEDESAVVHYSDGLESLVMGPNSDVLKYPKSLCRECNNTKTQPYDLAYDKFIDWVMRAEAEVLQNRRINFAQVFGDSWEDGQRNLYKYFAKSFGCRLIAKTKVPTDVVTIFNQSNITSKLLLSMAVNEDVLLMPKHYRDAFIGKGELLAYANRRDQTTTIGYTWNEHVSWLTICYWYGFEPDDKYGTGWMAYAQSIKVGSFVNLDQNMRYQLTEKEGIRNI